jgi:hypothetical protein
MSLKLQDFVQKIETIRGVLANIREDIHHLKTRIEELLEGAGLPQSDAEEIYALLGGLLEKSQSIDAIVPDREEPGDEEPGDDDEEDDGDSDGGEEDEDEEAGGDEEEEDGN